MKTKQEKKTFSRRNFLFASGGLIAGATLAACVAPAAAPPAPAAPAAEKPAEKPAEAPTAPAAEPTAAIGEYGAGGTPTVIWHGLGGADGATFASMLKDYAEKNNSPIRSETYNWDVFFQKYPTAIAAGTPPDWSIFHAAEVPQLGGEGLMMPMDDNFYAAYKIDKSDFNKSVMDTITLDGKTMCVPFDSHGWSCYVNTELVKAAGGDPENLPKNGDDFLKLAMKLTVDESGKHPDETGFNADKTKNWAIDFTWPRFSMPSTWFQFHGGKGGQYDSASKKALLNSEKSMAAVQYWHDLMYKHRIVRPAVPGIPWGGELYKTGNLAVMWEGTWSLNYFKDNPDIAAKTIAVPLNSFAPNGAGGQKIDSHIMSIPTGAKPDQVERALKLIRHLSDNGEIWATSGQIPARLSVQKKDSVQSIWSVKAAAAAFDKQGYTETPHKAFIELQTAWETAVGNALANTKPLKEALDEGNANIQAILDRG